MTKSRTYALIGSKSVFKISMLVTILTIAGVYFWGLGRHNTFFENSIISTTILSIAFFLFITIGLYNGVKLRDDLGKIVDKFKTDETPDLTPGVTADGPVDIGEGFAGIILRILLWILMAIVF